VDVPWYPRVTTESFPTNVFVAGKKVALRNEILARPAERRGVVAGYRASAGQPPQRPGVGGSVGLRRAGGRPASRGKDTDREHEQRDEQNREEDVIARLEPIG